MQLSKLDIAAGIYLMWGVVSGIFISELQWDSYIFTKWMVLAIIYLIIRMVPNKVSNILIISIIGAGVAQSIIAIAQQLGFMDSNHSMFPVTGFLGNPGQLGGFQAVVLILTTAISMQYKQLKYYIIPIMILIGYSVIIADSRAGWLAVIVGLLALFWRRLLKYIRGRKIILVPVITLIIIAGVALYHYRSGSADSRLLIWRVCADMIFDKPILGHGVGSFNNEYMLCQANYFNDNPESPFVMVADNVAYPYNELLHVWIEQGLVGVIIFAGIFIVAFRRASPIIRSALAALFTFSMFSYPSYVYPLLVLFPILLAISDPASIIQRCRKSHYVVGVSFSIIVSIIAINEIIFINDSKQHISKLLTNNDTLSASYFCKNYDRIMQYQRLNTIGALALIKHPELISDKRVEKVIPSCENWCDIGRIHQSRHLYQEAKAYYQEAANMIPARFKPKYYLWKMYVEIGKIQEALEIATSLINQQLKVESTFTLRSKAELREFINNVSS